MFQNFGTHIRIQERTFQPTDEAILTAQLCDRNSLDTSLPTTCQLDSAQPPIWQNSQILHSYLFRHQLKYVFSQKNSIFSGETASKHFDSMFGEMSIQMCD